ncbi:MAG: DUF4292 domain-containing protein [Bacteroidales bacterium]|nr:DUF4292 domain-containing protein [Bacteroidales bacterium]
MSKSRKTVLLLFLIGSLLASLSSCKTSRKLISRSELKKKSFSVLYNHMEKNQARYDYLSARLVINFSKEGGHSTNLKGWLRMKKDSIIWLSMIPAMGIEVARAEVTPDSLKLINRMNKSYFMGNYRLLDSLLHTSLDYDVVQALLMGNDMSGYQIQSSDAGVEGQDYVLVIKSRKMIRRDPIPERGQHSELVQKIWLNPENFRLRKVDMIEKIKGHKENRIQVFYDTYQTVNGQLFPQEMHVVFFSKPKTEISINFKRIETGQTFGFPFVIPKTYRKLEFSHE